MILGMAVGLLTYLAQQRLETLQSLSALPLADRFDNALASYAEYLRKALLPFDLCASYVRTSPVPVGTVLTSVGLLSSISVLAVRAWRHRPVILFGWLWFVLSLIPNIGFIQVGAQSMADRYTDLPLTGIFLMLAGVAQGFAARAWRCFALELAGIAALAFCGVHSFNQLSRWNNSLVLFSRAVRLNPENWVARLGLGMALTQEKRYQEALPHLKRAVALPGNAAEAHMKLGICLYRKGDIDEALTEFEKALAKQPSSAQIHFLIAQVLATSPTREARDGQRAIFHAGSFAPERANYARLFRRCRCLCRRR